MNGIIVSIVIVILIALIISFVQSKLAKPEKFKKEDSFIQRYFIYNFIYILSFGSLVYSLLFHICGYEEVVSEKLVNNEFSVSDIKTDSQDEGIVKEAEVLYIEKNSFFDYPGKKVKVWVDVIHNKNTGTGIYKQQTLYRVPILEKLSMWDSRTSDKLILYY